MAPRRSTKAGLALRWLRVAARAITCSAAVTACGVAPPFHAGTAGPHNRPAEAPDAIRATAREGYVYGAPMVALYQAVHAAHIDRDGAQYAGPFNTLVMPVDAPPGADRPADLCHGEPSCAFAALDLRREPLVIGVAPVPAQRYFALQVMDLYTHNVAYIGSRTTGNQGGYYLVAGPDWHGAVPGRIAQVIRVETRLASVIARTQPGARPSAAERRQIQAHYTLQPLSRFEGRAPPAVPRAVAWPTPLAQASVRSAPAFFQQLAFLLQFAPALASEAPLRARLAGIGVVPGQPMPLDTMPSATRQALRDGMADGQRQIDQRRAAVAGRSDSLFGSRGFLNNDYVARATGSQVALGTSSREEALSPRVDTDADGGALDGSAQAYVLRFGRDGLPPVDGFWSVSVDAPPGQQAVAAAQHRAQIDAAMLPQLHRDADGGITLYLQHPWPGRRRQANWLRVPRGPFAVTLRYYWPTPALLDNHWTAPPLERAPRPEPTGAVAWTSVTPIP